MSEDRFLRALFVMPLAVQRGGAELMLQHLIEHSGEARIEPTVAFFETGPMVDWCLERGVAVRVIEAGRLRQPRMLARTVRSLARLAREQQSDIIVGWMAKAQLYAGMAALGARIPCVWLQANTPTRLAAIDRLATLIPAATIIALSGEVQDAQRRLRPRRRTRLVHPGVDTARFDPERIGSPREVRQRLGLPLDGPTVGAVGRLQRWKGFDTLLEASPLVLERHPDATLVLVGGIHDLEPECATELNEQAARLGRNGHVRLVGHQPNPQEWMQAMDVVVHTSRNEPFGMVVIEAMALGKPVVASAEGGPTEVITPEVDGLLSPYGDHHRLAAAIIRLLDDDELSQRLGQAARLRAENFSVQQYARRFGEAIGEAVRANSSLRRLAGDPREA